MNAEDANLAQVFVFKIGLGNAKASVPKRSVPKNIEQFI